VSDTWRTYQSSPLAFNKKKIISLGTESGCGAKILTDRTFGPKVSSIRFAIEGC